MSKLTAAKKRSGEKATNTTAKGAVSPETYAQYAQEIEQALRQEHLAYWYPRAVDPKGGFYQDFGRTWRRGTGKGRKMIVYQARLTWLAATIAKARPDLRDEYLAYAHHGASFLIDHMWDQRYGGFFWFLNPGNRQPTELTEQKHIYGNAFAIYALAAAYKATGKAAYRAAAIRGFRWLEKHAADPEFGGYIEALHADGKPMLELPQKAARGKESRIESRLGEKTMNSHIHMLEAYAELYHIWPDKLLRKRIEHLLEVLLTKVISERHTQHQFLTREWKPTRTDEISFGHDVETVFLLLEAAEAIGKENDPKVLAAGKAMLDTSLRFGWDKKNGGIFYEGEYEGHVTNPSKEWWPQVECMNTLLLMHDLIGRKDGAYWDLFRQQWQFIRNHMIDRKHGGLYTEVSADGRTVHRAAKATMWKCPYHDGRSLLNVVNRLGRMAQS